MSRNQVGSPVGTMWAYFDASQSETHLTLAGLAATSPTWERFEPRWAEVLRKHGVSAAQMREHREPSFIADLEMVLREFGDQEDAFCSVSSMSRPSHKTVSERTPTIEVGGTWRKFPEASELCAYDCLNQLCWHYHTGQFALLFDRNESFFAKLYKPWNLRKGKSIGHPHLARVEQIEQGSSESHPPLQAADFFAWHVNRFWTRCDQQNSFTLGSIASTSSTGWDEDALSNLLRINGVLTGTSPNKV